MIQQAAIQNIACFNERALPYAAKVDFRRPTFHRTLKAAEVAAERGLRAANRTCSPAWAGQMNAVFGPVSF